MKTQAITYDSNVKNFVSSESLKKESTVENKNFGRLIIVCLVVNIIASMYLVTQMIELF